MKLKIPYLCVILCCWTVLGFCVEEIKAVETTPNERAIVSSHTSGLISRESKIRVRFSEDMVDSDSLNLPLESSPINFQPQIKGNAYWTDRRSLEFRPEKTLPPGQDYLATLVLSEIMAKAENSEIFSFEFSTFKQSFEITLDGLSVPNPKDATYQQLTGKIVTADSEYGLNLEQVLEAKMADKHLLIRWSHSADRLEHSFVVQGIRRQENSTLITLRWDGSPIGVDKKGMKIIPVPSIDTFKVSFARAVQEPEQYIEVRFSDPLQKQQDLQGLITVDNQRNLKFAIEGNTVRVYSMRPLSGSPVVKVNPGVRNSSGYRLKQPWDQEVFFQEVKPQVRFAGKGSIVPTTEGLTIPIETVNLRAVRVEALQIYENNIGQFLQVNELDGREQLKRVGRIIWKKTVRFDWSEDKRNRWVRYGLDVSPLIKQNSGGIYNLTLSFDLRHIAYNCAQTTNTQRTSPAEIQLENIDEEEEDSNWDFYEQNEDDNWDEYYENRNNPCHPAFYRGYGNNKIQATRNIFVSDIGLIAKMGSDNRVFVAATDIQTAQPLPDVALTLVDYQHQALNQGKTDGDGTALIDVVRKPFLLIAEHGDQRGYLKLDDGSALSVSHFDVAGETVTKGLKGFIYGERGVWRPGDPIYLTFILLNDDNRLPENHPVRFEMLNPKGQRIHTIIQKKSLNGFYSFQTKTGPDAPTGNWSARVTVGGATFQKTLKIETIMPNRLKIKLDFGGGGIQTLAGGKIDAELSANWLHGAIAKNLKADVELSFAPRKTSFAKYEAYQFDDPVRQYEPESRTIFEGNLDDTGKVQIKADIRAENISPGMLNANFKTRVFEPGGAFSIDRFSLPYHPYKRYVGVRVPKGDKARGMLLTDTDHPIAIVLLDDQGNPIPEGKVEIELYKIKWRWWWEKGEESLADYIGSPSYKAIQADTVLIQNGRGEWKLKIKYPSWGRYLIRVKDVDGNHITGKIVYVDWPGWAGRAQKDTPGGATVLSFSADKEQYTVGEPVVLTIPTGKKGRGLVSIETGSKILKTAWIEGGAEATRFEFPTTNEMAPNVYVHVTFLQPHLQAGNDLPIRMYGVIPIKVINPATRLQPVLTTPAVFVPDEIARITVAEADGRPMTYTVAVVDEGLLDLTRFQTPDPWAHFFNRESLGVKTWDLFDQVAGAYGGVLEQLLAIGGGESAAPAGQKKADRFPPMVRFIGPFELAAHSKNTHDIDIPQYVGSVRVMVVAGQNGAFGAAEQTVFVRKPLMILGTLPRVLGPEEEVDLPVSVFALEDKVKEVSVAVSTEGPLAVAGAANKRLVFTAPGDQLATFNLKALSQAGKAAVSIQAAGGGETGTQRIELDIRMPGGPVVDVIDGKIPANETWQKEIKLPGMAGTNKVMLEVSRVPPLNLGKRLNYLIRYPHGCVEQVTSSVFPQLYLDKLVELSPQKQDKVQLNIRAGIDRLRTFQATEGGFAYWPGTAEADEWATNYAGHFLAEAEKIGYLIPSHMLGQWKQYQRNRALSWVTGPPHAELTQAYRLYTLALAGAAELGAMNRLREEKDLPTAAKWRLAAAYQLAGQPEAAAQLVSGVGTFIAGYRELAHTYGSDLRDKAMILESLCLMDRIKRAELLAGEIAEELGGSNWLSTQTTAYALIAMARLAGITGGAGRTAFTYSWNSNPDITVAAAAPIVQKDLPVNGVTSAVIKLKNSGDRILYPRIIMEGFPPFGTETEAQNNLKLAARYFNLEGEPINPSRLEQGTDIVAEVTVENTGRSGIYEQVALTHMFASGWEIHNARLDPSEHRQDSGFDYQDIRDDRIYTYFSIKQGESKTFRVLLNSSYLGKFYLPMITVEAMYDASINARVPGQWCTVVNPGAETADKADARDTRQERR